MTTEVIELTQLAAEFRKPKTRKPIPLAPLAYRVDDAARVCGLSRGSIYNLLRDGKLTSVVVAGRRLIQPPHFMRSWFGLSPETREPPRRQSRTARKIWIWKNTMTTTANNRAAQRSFEVRAPLLRDFIFEVLAPVETDSAAARLCLQNDDDTGARYHLKRAVECVRAAAATFRELETLKAEAEAMSAAARAA